MKSGDPARNVRILFLVALLVLFVPSRLMALAHGANVARFAGATLSTLMAGVLLYRMCLRARHHTWFSIVSIPALYVSTFGAPLSGWGTLLALCHPPSHDSPGRQPVESQSGRSSGDPCSRCCFGR